MCGILNQLKVPSIQQLDAILPFERQNSLVFRCSLYFGGIENEAIDGVTKACKRREQEVVEYATAIIQEVNIANRRLRHLPSSECWLR